MIEQYRADRVADTGTTWFAGQDYGFARFAEPVSDELGLRAFPYTF
jgi:hypothetical protein